MSKPFVALVQCRLCIRMYCDEQLLCLEGEVLDQTVLLPLMCCALSTSSNGGLVYHTQHTCVVHLSFGLSLSCVEQVLYLEGEVLDLKGQLADMEEIKSDLEGHIADLSQELAAANKAAEKQASERSAALKVRGTCMTLHDVHQSGMLPLPHCVCMT